jgi:hypothetical protein
MHSTHVNFMHSLSNATERMRINSSGNVGIGTDAPGARLNVAGALGAVIGGGASAIRMTNTDTSNYASISAGIVGTSNGGMDFSVDGTRRMVISGSGKVGIGTDSPSAPLSIDTGTTGTIAQFRGADTDILNIDGDSDAIVLDARNVAYLGFEMQGTERMRIDSSGNVGIGTDNPATRLDIQGVGGATTSPSVTATTGTNYIGWKSVNTGGSFWTAIDNSTGSSFSTNTAYARVLWSNGAYPMVFSTNSTERIRIQSNGDITFYEDTGSTPKLLWNASDERLNVSGSDYQLMIQQGANQAWYHRAVSDGGYRLHLNGTGDIITVGASGNVGIGVSPSNLSGHAECRYSKFSDSIFQ